MSGRARPDRATTMGTMRPCGLGLALVVDGRELDNRLADLARGRLDAARFRAAAVSCVRAVA